jgi:hypothetical protein
MNWPHPRQVHIIQRIRISVPDTVINGTQGTISVRCGTGHTAETSTREVPPPPYFPEIGVEPFMLDKNTSDGAH